MIYYIYKVRRKQTSIRFSRSALPHRYLRYISWISWNGGYRPPPSTSWVFSPVPQLRTVCGGAYTLRPQQWRSCLCFRPEENNYSLIFPQEKERQSSFFLSRASHTSLLLYCAIHEPHTCRPRPICGRSAVRFSRRFLRPSHKQKMRARSIAPRTRSPRLSNVLKKA